MKITVLLFVLCSLISQIGIKNSQTLTTNNLLEEKTEVPIDTTYNPTRSSDNTSLEQLMTGIIFNCQIDGNQYSLPYRIYVPENYNSKYKYPLVTFFHGAGEMGNNNTSQLGTSFVFLPRLLNTENLKKYPCIVIAPQCTSGIRDTWVSSSSENRITTSAETIESNSIKAYRLLEQQIKQQYSIDNNRLYVTGVSMGGGATWDLTSRYPEYASIIPVCGNQVMTDKASQYINRNVWAFHAKTDEIVDYTTTIAMVDAIHLAGGKVKNTIYKNGNHASGWINAYNEPEVLDFMFSSRLNEYNDCIKELESETNIVNIKAKDAYLGQVMKYDVFVKNIDNNLVFAVVGNLENHFTSLTINIFYDEHLYSYTLDSSFLLLPKDTNKGLSVSNNYLFVYSRIISNPTLNLSYFNAKVTRLECYIEMNANGVNNYLTHDDVVIDDDNKLIFSL